MFRDGESLKSVWNTSNRSMVGILLLRFFAILLSSIPLVWTLLELGSWLFGIPIMAGSGFLGAILIALGCAFLATFYVTVYLYGEIRKREKGDKIYQVKGTKNTISGYTSHRAIPELKVRNIFKIPAENKIRDQRMKEVFLQNTGHMYLLSRTGSSYLHHVGPNWNCQAGDDIEGVGVESKLEQGVQVVVILENPYSENGTIRHRADEVPGPWRDLSWIRIKELTDKYTNLKIYFTSAPIHCSLFLTDNSVFYDPYHFGKLKKWETSKNNFLVIEFEKCKDSNEPKFYELLKRHFDFVLRDEATILSLDQFEKQYCDLLTQGK